LFEREVWVSVEKNEKNADFHVLGLFMAKKTDAVVGRVSTFHILQTSELAIFSRNPPQISKTSKSENHALKHS
jgi:hypothetical protein